MKGIPMLAISAKAGQDVICEYGLYVEAGTNLDDPLNLDVADQVEQKRLALFAHATQMGPEVFFAKIPPEAFSQLFSRESFQLVKSRVPASPPESDLFDGLR